MSLNDNYLFYEFDTEDGKIYTYKRTDISIDHKTGTIITDDEFGEMNELFTGMKCQLLSYYDTPKGRDGYSFSLYFTDTECRYRVGKYSILDYKYGTHKDSIKYYRELTPDEFIKKVRPLISDKDKYKIIMKEKIIKKEQNFIKQKEEYIKKQEEIYVNKKKTNEDAYKLLRLFIDY